MRPVIDGSPGGWGRRFEAGGRRCWGATIYACLCTAYVALSDPLEASSAEISSKSDKQMESWEVNLLSALRKGDGLGLSPSVRIQKSATRL